MDYTLESISDWIDFPHLANNDFHNKIAQNSNLESNADSSLAQPYKAPDDYKFHCFSEQIFIQVDTERFTSHTRTIFDTEWNMLDVVYYYPLPSSIPSKPQNIPTMLNIAELLGKNCSYVRVDLYSIYGQTIVGELTMTPEGGTGHFTPKQWDKKLGDLWR